LGRFEYLLSSAWLRLLGALFRRLPLRQRVVLASPRVGRLEGNLAFLLRALLARRPDLDHVVLPEPYGYGLRAKLAYLLRVSRGAYYLHTSRVFVVDNAYLPVHVAPHSSRTTVVQVWHAASAAKRFGLDTATPPAQPERTFLHRYYDAVIVSSEAVREPYSRALRTAIENVLALGTPRTDLFFDQPALAATRDRLRAAHPELAERRVVLYAPTFRGRGRGKYAASGLDAARLRAALPAGYALVLKTHPNLDPSLTARSGYDLVVDHTDEINDWLALADYLITDYSSSIYEYALLRRPLVLLVGDLAEYEREPGMYVDYRTEMAGTQVTTTDEVAEAILHDRFDLSGYEALLERHVGACDGHASERVADYLLALLDG
jgi:CDP-glycerol glycerophosphotransferase (TagB/SpsB family)